MVGLKPIRPQFKAGILIEPPVSDPNAILANPSLTMQASPPVDPPALLSLL
mgnify:CR=1 FL=1